MIMYKKSHLALPLLMVGFGLFSLAVKATDFIHQRADMTPKVQFKSIGGINGQYQDVIDIELPAFRGITPALSLAYDSNAGNGFTGMGWTLSTNTHSIRRIGANGGAPAFDTTDKYLLDGHPLIASTSLGGTHVTQWQSFDRITQQANDWLLTRSDGTAQLMGAVQTNAQGAVEWRTQSETDTLGNQVQYSWYNDADKAIYLDTISYSGYLATLVREARPDVVTAARFGELSSMSHRLKAINVKVNGQLLKETRLSYTQSSSNNRSLLSSTQVFGKDNITALPMSSMSYSGSTSSWASSPQVWSDPAGSGFLTKVDNASNPDVDITIVDMNGDDLPDRVQSGSTTWSVWLNNGSSFSSSAISWNNPSSQGKIIEFNGSLDTIADLIDMDGDNLPDRVVYINSTQWKVYRNTGSGFVTTAEIWTNPSSYSRPNELRSGEEGDVYAALMDLNGDNKPDRIAVNGTSEYKIYFNNGLSFNSTPETWANPVNKKRVREVCAASACSSPRVRQSFYDLNGDGRVDILNYDGTGDGTWDVYLNNGQGFEPKMDWAYDANNHNVYPVYMDANAGVRDTILDLNGDGLPDAIRDGTTWKVQLGSGDSFTANSFVSWTNPSGQNRIRMRNASKHLQHGLIDMNGDGLLDRVGRINSSGMNVWLSQGDAASSLPDKLISFTRPSGLNTQISYKMSTADQDLTLPVASQNIHPKTLVVDSIAEDSGFVVSTTSFDYLGGKVHWYSNASLGFAQVKTTLPKLSNETLAPYLLEDYSQMLVQIGDTIQSARYDGNGNLLTKEISYFSYSGDGASTPYVNQEIQFDRELYAGANSRIIRETYTYDSYGQITQLQEHGDLNLSGDEKTTVTTFLPNTALFIVDKPSTETIYAGLVVGQNEMRHEAYFYDGATTNIAPTAGLLTKSQRKNDTGSLATLMTSGYDSDGNVIWEDDALARRTSYTYESTFNLYPESSTNALNQVTHTVTSWDIRCGMPLTETNINGLTTTYQVDALCRQTRVDYPGGAYERMVFNNTGNPTTQNITTYQNPPPGHTLEKMKAVYTDGFERTHMLYQGVGTMLEMEGAFSFNARGLMDVATELFYTGESNYTSSYTYDPLDRVIQTDNFDGVILTQQYTENSIILNDGVEPQRELIENAYGEQVEFREDVGANMLTSYATYDVLGRITSEQNDLGQTHTSTYNYLDVAISTTDYEGNITTSVYDAAGQGLSFTITEPGESPYTNTTTYDALGRTLTETNDDRVTTYTYDEPRTGYFNLGMQTTEVTTPTGISARTKETDHDAFGYVGKVRNTGEAIDEVTGLPVPYDENATFTFAPGGYQTQSLSSETGAVINYGFDALGRDYSVSGSIASMDYDANSTLILITYEDGTTEVPE